MKNMMVQMVRIINEGIVKMHEEFCEDVSLTTLVDVNNVIKVVLLDFTLLLDSVLDVVVCCVVTGLGLILRLSG